MSLHRWVGALLVIASAAGCSCGTEERLDLTSNLECEGCTTEADGTVVLDFGTVVIDTTAELPLVLRNRGSATMRVALPAFAPVFAASPRAFSLPAGGTQEVRISYAPVEEVEDVSEGVVQGEGSRGLAVRLSGRGARVDVVCEPRDLSFGAVVVDSERTLPLSCRNRKPDVDARLKLTLEGEAEFRAVSSSVVTIPGGGSTTVDLRFAPVEAGPRTARLLVDSELGDRLQAVGLDGLGIDSALSIEPGPDPDGCYDVGFVVPGGSKRLSLAAVNAGNLDVHVTSATVDPAKAPFRLEPAAPWTVAATAPGAPSTRHTFDVVFEPGALGPAQATIRLTSDDRDNGTIDLCVKGHGGGPIVSCSPSTISFGLTDVNTPRGKQAFCTNVGTEVPGVPESWLAVESLGVDAPFSARVAGDASVTYAPGDSFRVDLTFAPDAERVFGGQLAISTNGGTAVIPASGEGKAFEPCTYELKPEGGLDFGTVNRNHALQLLQVLVNRGEHDCLLTDVEIAGENGRFFEKTGFEEPLVVPAGESVRIPVTFSAGFPGDYGASLDLTVNGPGRLSLPLSAHVIDLCLDLSVDDADFGTVEPGCQSPARYVQIVNACRTAVTITQVDLPETSSSAFSILEGPGGPVFLPAGGVLEVAVGYDPLVEGDDVGQLHVYTDAFPGAVIGLLHGRGGAVEEQVDSFRGEGKSSADILWVIDNSGSMGQEQAGIARNAAPFIDIALDRRIDFRMAVTSTDMDGGGLSGRFYPLSQSHPRILTNRREREDLERDWAYLINLGTNGSGSERGLLAARTALSAPLINSLDLPDTPEKFDGNMGFLRRDANLTIIIVSDEEDQSYPDGVPGPGYWEGHLSFFRNIKGERRSRTMLRVHTITGGYEGCDSPDGNAGPGTGYNEVSEATGGVIQSICAADWSESLAEVAESAFTFESCFTLHGRPGPPPGETSTDPETWLRIDFSGQEPYAKLSPSGNVRWRYDPQTNDVCFSPDYLPAPSDYVDVQYTVACEGR